MLLRSSLLALVACSLLLPIASAQVDPDSFAEEKLDFPITPGPFEPSWESIAEQHPGGPAWFRDAKFGVWIHWGPQAAGKSNDWYAKKMYLEDEKAYRNHRKYFGHPSEFGYKDVLNQWSIPDFDAAKYMQMFRDAGFRYANIMGVHHDNFDLWDSKHQPWNSVNIGPKRDIVGEWVAAARDEGIRYGISFHHEYTWWWWQPAFGADSSGPKAGVPYDGVLTKEDGKGKWWEGYDPRQLYGRPLEGYPEYEPVHLIAHGRQGIFDKHLPYAREYATQWAERIMDAVEQYDPDWIYTDGNSRQPFSGKKSGSGFKCDAAQRVVADFFNRTTERRSEVDTFAIIKFSKAQPGLASTSESRIPSGAASSDKVWMGEMAIGGWFYEPGFYYDASYVVKGLLEFASRDGNFAVSVPLTPTGGMEPGCPEMLEGVGRWMKLHGEGIYGSYAWEATREGDRNMPRGALGRKQVEFEFTPEDLRYTRGKDGSLYVWCMTVPPTGTKLCAASMGEAAGLLGADPKSVTLLATGAECEWTRDGDALWITCPDTSTAEYALGFRVEVE
ncbi:Alpha-L-fucosidase [Pseudobythopirellula maris]|uniref:alpha-L-fucosidase n=1 Tax=Pseudobythopirellula maris TaxID=2527991 RepID=A0A5C5ZMS1_9BACT|nr:alpha-L-fucosidase [Pseudobythopirellula maris]TWT87743.1 Alpha-L-fucosidase [Pseudobythopirellula maris]